jgi:hypothetical protein
MIVKNLMLCCGVIAPAGPAYAQVELKTYADRDGYPIKWKCRRFSR